MQYSWLAHSRPVWKVGPWCVCVCLCVHTHMREVHFLQEAQESICIYTEWFIHILLQMSVSAMVSSSLRGLQDPKDSGK